MERGRARLEGWLLVDQPPRCVFLPAAWAEALTQAGQDDSARWVLAEDDDGPLAALPFELRRAPAGSAAACGSSPTSARPTASSPTGPGPTAVRTALLAAMAASGEPVDLVDLPVCATAGVHAPRDRRHRRA